MQSNTILSFCMTVSGDIPFSWNVLWSSSSLVDFFAISPPDINVIRQIHQNETKKGTESFDFLFRNIFITGSIEIPDNRLLAMGEGLTAVSQVKIVIQIVKRNSHKQRKSRLPAFLRGSIINLQDAATAPHIDSAPGQCGMISVNALMVKGCLILQHLLNRAFERFVHHGECGLYVIGDAFL